MESTTDGNRPSTYHASLKKLNLIKSVTSPISSNSPNSPEIVTDKRNYFCFFLNQVDSHE